MNAKFRTLSFVSGIAVGFVPLLAQGPPAVSQPTPAAIEFPVAMRQKVEAGKSPVGTKVQAELIVATWVDGTTIPREALFNGEVIESVAKTKTEPSRLAIRVDSVQWKGGSMPIKAYLTAWFYPIQFGAAPDLHYGPTEGPTSKTWNGMGTYPDSSVSKPFPDSSVTDQRQPTPDTPATIVSNRRTLMRDVEVTRGQDGAAILSSKRVNLKLDKLTTYVLATGDLAPRK